MHSPSLYPEHPETSIASLPFCLKWQMPSIRATYHQQKRPVTCEYNPVPSRTASSSGSTKGYTSEEEVGPTCVNGTCRRRPAQTSSVDSDGLLRRPAPGGK